MAVSPFEHSKIIMKKLPKPENLDGYSQWMINKIFSCDKTFSHLARLADRLQMTNEEHFDFYYGAVPRSNKFIPYLAKKKKVVDSVKMLAEHFEVNEYQAAQYLEMISKDELKNIKELKMKKDWIRSKRK